MSLVVATFPDCCTEKILCFYINATSALQVIKITNISGFYFERLAFPGQRLLFEAFPAAELSVFTSGKTQAITMDSIPCRHLQVEQSDER